METIAKHPSYPLYKTFNRWENRKKINGNTMKITIRSVEEIQDKMNSYTNVIAHCL